MERGPRSGASDLVVVVGDTGFEPVRPHFCDMCSDQHSRALTCKFTRFRLSRWRTPVHTNTLLVDT